MRPHEIIASLHWWRAEGDGMPWLLLSGKDGEFGWGKVARASDGRYAAYAPSFTLGRWALPREVVRVTSLRQAKRIVADAVSSAIVAAAKYRAEEAIGEARWALWRDHVRRTGGHTWLKPCFYPPVPRRPKTSTQD